MAKKRKRRTHPSASTRSTTTDPAHVTRAEPRSGARTLDTVALTLVALGIALTAYLTAVAWFGEHPAYCSADSDCDLVQSSRWSTLLGMPMALWGLLTYAVLARFIWRLRRRATAWRGALLIAMVGTVISWYLTVVSVVSIEATCAYCLASLAIMNLILVTLLLRRPAQVPEHAWKRALPAPLAAAAVVLLALHLHFSGLFDPAAGPEDPNLKALAMHLRQDGVRFYGAYWCLVCQQQKALFEASGDRLPYVECTPGGRNGPVNMACVNANVRDYPTWLINGVPHTGVLQPKRLAQLTGFKWQETPR